MKRFEKGKQIKNFLNNYGYKKFIKLEGSSKVIIDEKKIEQASQWDGLHGVITNIKEMEAIEIINHYHELWQIEETFRISKHDLRIRPIYHWTSRRIKSHIAICFISLVCLRVLAHRVKVQYSRLSVEVIIKILTSVQVSILKDIKTKKRYAIPSKITQEIKKIYQVVGKKISDQPFEITK
jgi:transposase